VGQKHRESNFDRGGLILFLLGTLLTLIASAFAKRQFIRNKSKEGIWRKRAKTATIFSMLAAVLIAGLAIQFTEYVWFTGFFFLGLFLLLRLAIIHWPWPKHEKPPKKERIKAEIFDILTVVFTVLSFLTLFIPLLFFPVILSSLFFVILAIAFSVFAITSFIISRIKAKKNKAKKNKFWSKLALICMGLYALSLLSFLYQFLSILMI